mmetsp:Transcript_1633/g.3976  ORF Transcript_1633/g.3976 Transcript_1633/m.3976 type:complete len:237 (-) Transcript_1633:2-712(-)
MTAVLKRLPSTLNDEDSASGPFFATNSTIARLWSCGRLLNSAGTATGGVGAAMRPSSLDRSASTAVCTWVVSSETLPLLMSCESFSVPLAIEAISFSPSCTSAAGTFFRMAADLPLMMPRALDKSPLALEKSSRERLSWQLSRAACRSRTSLGWPGSPSRSSESGSLFTLLPLPDASSLAWTACVCSAGGAIICSGERRRSAASAAATPPVCTRGGGAAAGAMRERGRGTSIGAAR